MASVNVGKEGPDFLVDIGTDPKDEASYGKIVYRLDLPNKGDELHHLGYNHDKTKLTIPGLFSGRIHIADVSDPARPRIESVRDDLTGKSGQIVPHTVIGQPNGNNLVTKIGSNSKSTAPGGLVERDGSTGRIVRIVSARAGSNGTSLEYMHDQGIKTELNRAVTTSFGLPAKVAGGITVAGLGTDLYLWDWNAKKVIQKVNIGKSSAPWKYAGGTTPNPQ